MKLCRVASKKTLWVRAWKLSKIVQWVVHNKKCPETYGLKITLQGPEFRLLPENWHPIWTKVILDFETITICLSVGEDPVRLESSSHKEIKIFVKHVMGPFLPFVTCMFLFKPFKRSMELFIPFFWKSLFHKNMEGRDLWQWYLTKIHSFMITEPNWMGFSSRYRIIS